MYSLKLFLHRLSGADIVKVFSLNAVATLIRMLCGMISVKVVALIIGPSGIALLGQLSNFSTIFLGIANGGINTGITKYVAEFKEDDLYTKKLLSNALRITIFCTFVVSFVMIVGCVHLSKWILMSEEYYYIFIIFGITIILYTLNSLLISVINGYKQFKRYVKINIIGTVLGLIYSIILVTTFGLSGALVNAVTFQSIMFFITLYLCRNEHWLKSEFFCDKFDKLITKKYFGYSVMTFTSLALLPVSQLILRGYVITDISASDAGIWEGMNRISNMYLSVITTAFSIYYLPRLSELQTNQELHKEVIRCYKFIIPTLFIIESVFFLLRHFILWFLYTPAFYPMEDLFCWQLAGDFAKICSWILAFIMVAKAKTKMYLTTEIIFDVAYLVISFLFLRWNGIIGLTQGYLFITVLYMLLMMYLFRGILWVPKH